MEPVTSAASGEFEDCGKRAALMSPLIIAENFMHRAELTDLIVEPVIRSAGFRRGLPDGVLTGLATLVRMLFSGRSRRRPGGQSGSHSGTMVPTAAQGGWKSPP